MFADFGTTYTIKSGDTLGKIAARYGTTVAAIARDNGITDVNKIEVGQVLQLDEAGTVAVSPTVKPEGGIRRKTATVPLPTFKISNRMVNYILIGGIVALGVPLVFKLVRARA